MFLLTPPDQEAIETAEKLKRHYDRVITLWQKKHLRMRQNMIFATIKVVKSWDFQQYMSMEKEQRIAIRRALNEDSEKLIQEGEPNDPQLKRLQREIEEVNRLFDEWERRYKKSFNYKLPQNFQFNSTLKTFIFDSNLTSIQLHFQIQT